MTREEAIEYLYKLFMQADITDAYGDMDDTEPYETAIDMAVKALQEQKTGEWIESEQRDRTICSVCGSWQDLKAKFLFSFCPNCGTRMKCK